MLDFAGRCSSGTFSGIAQRTFECGYMESKHAPEPGCFKCVRARVRGLLQFFEVAAKGIEEFSERLEAHHVDSFL